MNQKPMDQMDGMDPIEARLAALRPAEPPAELMSQMLDAEPGRVRWVPWAWAAPLAAAAAWLIMGQLTHHTLPPSTPVSLLSQSGTPRSAVLPSDFRVFVPISERSHLVGVSDLGVVDVAPARPVRLLRTTWIDDTTFRGDDGRSVIRRATPRETIIPVALEVF